MTAAPSPDRLPLHRRALLTALGGAAVLPFALHPLAAVAQATQPITVLYRRESAQAPTRLDPAVQAATLALENEFLQRGFRVLQPTAELYQMLEQGAGVVLTFAEDAGFSLVYSAYTDVRPVPGQEAGIGEVRLSARVFVGRNILVADEGRGQMFTRLEPAVREFGMRRALELAARRAAADLAEKAGSALRAVTPERLGQLAPGRPAQATTATVVGVSPPSAAVAAAPVPVPVPVTATTTPAQPVQAPAPLPAPRNRFALLVGMSDYGIVRRGGLAGIGDLPGVKNDVAFVNSTLRGLGFSAERIRTFTNEQCTGAAVRGALKDIAGQSQPDDLVLIYFAAHGIDKEASTSGYGMPVLADFRPNDPGTLDFWELQSFAKNLRGRVLWINDTCHSGGAATNVTSVIVGSGGVSAARNVRGPDVRVVAGAAAPGQDFAILTACSPSEISWEDSSTGGGLFTTALFRQIGQTQGQVPLARLFAEQVQAAVINESRKICARQKCEHPQQTPTMAVNGLGHLIRL